MLKTKENSLFALSAGRNSY